MGLGVIGSIQIRDIFVWDIFFICVYGFDFFLLEFKKNIV